LLGCSDESDKENRENGGGGDVVQQTSPSCRREFGVQSPDLMDVDDDVDDDGSVDARRRHEAAPRPPHRHCRPDALPLVSAMQARRRRPLPLGTIDEATETSTFSASDSRPEEERPGGGGGVAPEPETPPCEIAREATSGPRRLAAVDDDDGGGWIPDDAVSIRSELAVDVGRWIAEDTVSIQSELAGDGGGGWGAGEVSRLSVESETMAGRRGRRCGGWQRFASARSRLTVAEFCRRRESGATRKRQRETATDDRVSVNDSVASLDVSTKRRRTSLRVGCVTLHCAKTVDCVVSRCVRGT